MSKQGPAVSGTVVSNPNTERFAGGLQFSGGPNNGRDRWVQAYQTIRANKAERTRNVARSQRPNAFTLMRKFYTGVSNPETRSATLKHGPPVTPTASTMKICKKFTDELLGPDGASTTARQDPDPAELGDIESDGARNIGEGFVADLMHAELVTMERLPPEVRKQLRVQYDNRPYFTSWVMFVNIVILTVTLCAQGFAPVGYADRLVTKQMMRHNQAYETLGYNQSTNFWIGPDYQSLIHLGAKYSPCMREDNEYFKGITGDAAIEDTTGCCIRSDINACWQSAESACTSTFARFNKGKVCGLGREGCSKEAFSNVTLWAGAYSTWPNCPIEKEYKSKLPNKEQYRHLKCEVYARPCCVGLQGECVLISQEECEFKKGFFHEDAALCSHVSCITDICGLSGFLLDNLPDQFYRALLPTFMHAGILHLLITLVFQATVLRDMEKFAGWWRIGFIYFASGIGGTMFSAILIPYQPEVGASGALYGILASLIVEVLVNWRIYKFPTLELSKLLLCVAVLFLAGLLPWVDNFAHFGGFLFGFLTSFVVFPQVHYSEEDRIVKLVVQVACGVTAVALFALLFVVFYLAQDMSCENCSYINCIPLTHSFCQDSTMELRPRIGN